jgi:hypothetical protein
MLFLNAINKLSIHTRSKEECTVKNNKVKKAKNSNSSLIFFGVTTSCGEVMGGAVQLSRCSFLMFLPAGVYRPLTAESSEGGVIASASFLMVTRDSSFPAWPF